MPLSPLRIIEFPGDPRVVIAAPHGHDFHTDKIVAMVCRMTGFSGLAVKHMEDQEDGHHRVNVNRPTEGAGLKPWQELATLEAIECYREYVTRIMALAGGDLRGYVEVHGNETQRHVEVAQVGVPGELLQAAKVALHGIPCGALIEGMDSVVKDAMANKSFGVLRLPQMALHFELPDLARDRRNRPMTADSIARAVMAVFGEAVDPYST